MKTLFLIGVLTFLTGCAGLEFTYERVGRKVNVDGFDPRTTKAMHDMLGTGDKGSPCPNGVVAASRSAQVESKRLDPNRQYFFVPPPTVRTEATVICR